MKHNTKEAMYITEMYKRSSDTELWQVYGNYSRAKAEAFDYCKRLMTEHDGSDLRILSHNTFMFTAAFQFMNQETGEAMIMYITPSKNKPVFWTEEEEEFGRTAYQQIDEWIEDMLYGYLKH